jgi:predicted adenylyl cyclase CyaB
MPIELEAKFLEIDRDEMRAKLATLGYLCITPEYLMRRVVFDMGESQWARVRDEAGITTVSYKRTHDGGRVDGTEEIQIVADSFENAAKLLAAFGLQQKSYQETRREVWVREGVEVTLDEWPALAPFCEIEAPSEAALMTAAAALGFDWAAAMFGPVGAVYERMVIPAHVINQAPRVTFENLEEIMALGKVV